MIKSDRTQSWTELTVGKVLLHLLARDLDFIIIHGPFSVRCNVSFPRLGAFTKMLSDDLSSSNGSNLCWLGFK